jgi:phosphotransferase system HPr (HPr) family protein
MNIRSDADPTEAAAPAYGRPDLEAEDMVRRSVQIQYEGGLHMRPAVLLVQACQKFQAQACLWLGDRKADLRNIWDLLALGAGQGMELILEADGPDATEACDALEAILGAPDMTAQPIRGVPPKG